MGYRETDRKDSPVLGKVLDEFEVIVFNLQWIGPESGLAIKTSYGINVGRMMELVAMPKKITEIHERGHASFKGVFLLRGKTIPLIDLCEVQLSETPRMKSGSTGR